MRVDSHWYEEIRVDDEKVLPPTVNKPLKKLQENVMNSKEIFNIWINNPFLNALLEINADISLDDIGGDDFLSKGKKIEGELKKVDFNDIEIKSGDKIKFNDDLEISFSGGIVEFTPSDLEFKETEIKELEGDISISERKIETSNDLEIDCEKIKINGEKVFTEGNGGHESGFDVGNFSNKKPGEEIAISNDTLQENLLAEKTNGINEPSTISDLVYPVGAILISADNDFRPGEDLGFGVWERVSKNRFIKSGLNIGEVGGEEFSRINGRHTPNHTHETFCEDDGDHQHSLHSPGDERDTANSGGSNVFRSGTMSTGNWRHSHHLRTGVSGDNYEHYNMPPYVTVNFWRRRQ